MDGYVSGSQRPWCYQDIVTVFKWAYLYHHPPHPFITQDKSMNNGTVCTNKHG